MKNAWRPLPSHTQTHILFGCYTSVQPDKAIMCDAWQLVYSITIRTSVHTTHWWMGTSVCCALGIAQHSQSTRLANNILFNIQCRIGCIQCTYQLIETKASIKRARLFPRLAHRNRELPNTQHTTLQEYANNKSANKKFTRTDRADTLCRWPFCRTPAKNAIAKAATWSRRKKGKQWRAQTN